MVRRQLPPRYMVRYEQTIPSRPAMYQVKDVSEGASTWYMVHEREATTLAGAKSIQRALQRRGYRVHGIYERINLRFRPSLHEDKMLVCGKMEWDWDVRWSSGATY